MVSIQLGKPGPASSDAAQSSSHVRSSPAARVATNLLPEKAHRRRMALNDLARQFPSDKTAVDQFHSLVMTASLSPSNIQV
jgi:hypothetical protein